MPEKCYEIISVVDFNILTEKQSDFSIKIIGFFTYLYSTLTEYNNYFLYLQ
jgi:hypothetical protein